MEKAQYSIYVADNIDLVRSMVIVSIDIAKAINEDLSDSGYSVNADRPETWKYYMNLNGDYHESDGSSLMVVSMDTLQPIEFTKEVLDNHPVTKSSYMVGSDSYNELIYRNPEHQELIKGIVLPTSYDKTIGVDNYTILNWNAFLVEDCEYDLIANIQRHIDGFILRHYTKAYTLSDNLYIASFIAILYHYILTTLLTIRLDNCHTMQANSFHVWTYLSGFSQLDNWRNVLDDYQARYLYRNIRWLIREAGSDEALKEMVSKLLARKGLPVYGFDIVDILTDMPQEITPSYISERYRIDNEVNITNLSGTKSIEELTASLNNVAIYNTENATDSHEKLKNMLSRSGQGRVTTKIMESEVVNDIENSEMRIREIALDHWCSLSSNNYYSVPININYPPARINHQILTSDAFILYTYCMSRYSNVTLIDIPDFKVYNVRRTELPDIHDIRYITDSRYLSYDQISLFINRRLHIIPVASVMTFNVLCYDIMKEYRDDLIDRSNASGIEQIAQVNLMTQTSWQNGIYNVSSDETYRNFFNRLNIDESFIQSNHLLELASIVYERSTGFTMTYTGNELTMQSQLMALLERLSSYNVIFISDSTYADAVPIYRKLIHQSNGSVYARAGTIHQYLPICRPIYSDNTIAAIPDELDYSLIKIADSIYLSHKTHIDLSINISDYNDVINIDRIQLPRVGILP